MKCFSSLRGLLIPTLAILVLGCRGVFGDVCGDFCDSVRPGESGRDSFTYYCLLTSSPNILVDCAGLCNPCRHHGYCRGFGASLRWNCPAIPALPGCEVALIDMGCIIGLVIIVGICFCVLMWRLRRNRTRSAPAKSANQQQYQSQSVVDFYSPQEYQSAPPRSG